MYSQRELCCSFVLGIVGMVEEARGESVYLHYSLKVWGWYDFF